MVQPTAPPAGRSRLRGIPRRLPSVVMLRFAAVGVCNTAVDLAVYFALAAVFPPAYHPWLAAAEAAVGWLAGTASGLVLHSRVTFRCRLPATGFYAVAGAGMLLQTAVTAIASQWWGGTGAVVGKPLGILLASGFTYLGYRLLAIGRPRPRQLAPLPVSAAADR